MGKLHELLAVEGDLSGTCQKILDETKTTFEKKADHFFGFHRVLTSLIDGEINNAPDEHKEMADTVHNKLDYMKSHVIRYFDAVLQKECTNQNAVADVVVDGTTIMSDVPATFLLGLETKLKAVRAVYNSTPTLPPGIKWEADENKGEHVYSMSHPEEVFKTAKTFQHKVLVPAQFPKEGEGGQSLPAQIEKWEESKNVGMYTKNIWSGMITPAEKSALLGRIDKLMRGVKKAKEQTDKK